MKGIKKIDRRRDVAITFVAAIGAAIMILPVPRASAQEAVAPDETVSIDSQAISVGQSDQRQGLDEAWWTGPILASNAETLPAGHFYFEPYVFDFIQNGHGTPGSLSYVLYGVAPRFTAGVLPSFSYARDAEGKRHLSFGDVTLNFQYRLTAPNPRRTKPSFAIVFQPRLPTAPFDRLKVAGSGAGSGNFAAMVGLYGQQYLWMPNGRIVRARFNLTHTFEGSTRVHGVSVYGTPDGFNGRVHPGDSTVVDIAAEYSLSKRVVLALDVLHRWDNHSVVRDFSVASGRSVSPERRSLAIAPGIEYNWSPTQGVIVGARWILKGHNSEPSFTPVIAYNLFL